MCGVLSFTKITDQVELTGQMHYYGEFATHWFPIFPAIYDCIMEMN